MPQLELFLTPILIQEPLILALSSIFQKKKKFQSSIFQNLLKYFASNTDPDTISLTIIA